MTIEKFSKALNLAGQELASTWGAYYLGQVNKDSINERFTFYCVEDNEYFTTDISFDDFKEMYNRYESQGLLI